MNASRAEIDIDFAAKIATVENVTETLSRDMSDLAKIVGGHEKTLTTLESLPRDVAQIRNALYLLVLVMAFKDQISTEGVMKILNIVMHIMGIPL